MFNIQKVMDKYGRPVGGNNPKEFYSVATDRKGAAHIRKYALTLPGARETVHAYGKFVVIWAYARNADGTYTYIRVTVFQDTSDNGRFEADYHLFSAREDVINEVHKLEEQLKAANKEVFEAKQKGDKESALALVDDVAAIYDKFEALLQT